MDPHSEVEIKFAADSVSIRDFHKFVANYSSELLNSGKEILIDGFKKVDGVDTFYKFGDNVLRCREDFDGNSEFTYKSRKSDISTTDRTEINVPIKQGTDSGTIIALLTGLGAKELFKINKTSHIYHIRGLTKELDVYEATFALYTVFKEGKSTRAFLEVEIEAASACTPEDAMEILDAWTKRIRKHLGLKKPLNSSLYEIYNEQ